MRDWWQKLSIDWPCALGDWLWIMLVVEPARLIDKITPTDEDDLAGALA